MPDSIPPPEFGSLGWAAWMVAVLALWTGGPSLCNASECDFTNSSCGWMWSGGLELISMDNYSSWGDSSAPTHDAHGDYNGQILYYSAKEGNVETMLKVRSPRFRPPEKATCSLQYYTHMYNMNLARFKIIVDSDNITSETFSFHGDSEHNWDRRKHTIGRLKKSFHISLELLDKSSAFPSHLAIDDIRITDCYEKSLELDECLPRQFECSNGVCIDDHKVCDMTEDCAGGEDETQECEKIPKGAACTFEMGTCGWTTGGTNNSVWLRQSGRSASSRNAPNYDHTFQNESGVYLITKFQKGFGSEAILTSPEFDPPPLSHLNPESQFFNSCAVRFFLHKFGISVGELRLNSVELNKGPSKEPKVEELWRSYGNKGNFWWPLSVTLKNVTNRYYLQFIAGKTFANSEIAIDDISLSPKCFGIGIPPNDSANFSLPVEGSPRNYNKPESSIKKYDFGTCGAKGRQGPSHPMCILAYNTTSTAVQVSSEPGMEGTQKWIVPIDGIFTVLVRGAGGGIGSQNLGQSYGTSIRATFNWTAGETIHIVVGQEGVSACAPESRNYVKQMCDTKMIKRKRNIFGRINKARELGGGGGGGGATYVYKMDGDLKIPLIIAAGGGGLSAKKLPDKLKIIDPNGRGVDYTLHPGNGFTLASGGGGGWNDTTRKNSSAGKSLMEGSVGGAVCERARLSWDTYGGFGGGGGGCGSGGGGGGYTGGDAAGEEDFFTNGKGGTSYLIPDAIHPSVNPGQNEGDGSVVVIPAQEGCGCKHLCVILDLDNKEPYCICPPGQTLSIDGFSCSGYNGSGFSNEDEDEWTNPKNFLVLILGITVPVGAVVFFACLGLMRYRKNRARDLSHEPLNNPEVQLSQLRNAGAIMVTDNPNYEFGGSTCTVQDLREIPREHLSLVKALGQGAFGEVYEGYLTNPSTDNSEIPVAVKTLPELSTSQAELDFKMEALIMSKFSHPNIVSFIGVCFEKLPKFIILELLPGGDLKSYLRECRPKPEEKDESWTDVCTSEVDENLQQHTNQKPSPLTVTDLLMLALDVAKGCQYLEENHFIHRDIAARNCLLTTKEAERVVKIADFGMARDIYRADYYRKGGKAMLPVKWMPPEAFLDGIFTSKTDVWSFGVLLWEVISLGYMPYPGRGNQEVMQLVTSGGRLEPPTNCPSPVYHIMMQCWHPLADERPNFTTIIERLGYCLQDPDVFNAPLPVFNRAPSMERDATVMRPADADNGGFLRVQRPDPGLLLSPGSEDYLIPMPQSTYSITTERTDLQSSPSMGSVDQLLELEERGSAGGDTPSSKPSTWETNFMTPDTPTDGPAGHWNDLNNPSVKSSDLRHNDHGNSIQSLKKHPGGYTEIPTEDEEPHADVTMPKKIASSSSQKILARDQSLDALPEAPHIMNANEACQLKTSSPMTNNHSHLSLDPSTLARQVGDNMPRRYMNVDVNFNSGDGSSTGNNPSFEQNTANRNVGPYDGYAGVNPVA